MMGCDGNGYVLSIFFPDHNVEILFKQFGKNHIQSGWICLSLMQSRVSSMTALSLVFSSSWESLDSKTLCARLI